MAYALRPVSNPAPIPTAVLEDVKATLAGLQPGVYSSRTLYDRYAEILKSGGREPASPTAFGQMVAKFGALRCSRTVNGKSVRAWRI
jgi:hypothetical protein